jgi:DNA-binding transcriptional LysR family regulator
VIADPTYGRVLLAPLVPRFLDSFPDIALDVVLDAGEGAEWDVAIRAGSTRPEARRQLLGAPPAVLCARLPIYRNTRRRIAPRACATTPC